MVSRMAVCGLALLWVGAFLALVAVALWAAYTGNRPLAWGAGIPAWLMMGASNAVRRARSKKLAN